MFRGYSPRGGSGSSRRSTFIRRWLSGPVILLPALVCTAEHTALTRDRRLASAASRSRTLPPIWHTDATAGCGLGNLACGLPTTRSKVTLQRRGPGARAEWTWGFIAAKRVVRGADCPHATLCVSSPGVGRKTPAVTLAINRNTISLRVECVNW